MLITTVNSFSIKPISRFAVHQNKKCHAFNSFPARSTTLYFSIDDLSVGLYDAQLVSSDFIETNLATSGPISILILYLSGLLAAFSPCVISMLPLTIAYLGLNDNSSNTNDPSSNSSNQNMSSRVSKTAAFALGLSSVLCSIGAFAATAGKAINPSSDFGILSSLFVAAITTFMGLNLLDIVKFTFPNPKSFLNSFNTQTEIPLDGENNNPNSKLTESFFFGATTALVASPCSSPVLASLIAVVGSLGNPLQGIVLLFAYSVGYVTPVIIAGFLSGSVYTLVSTAKNTSWINVLFASVFIFLGTYKTLEVVNTVIN